MKKYLLLSLAALVSAQAATPIAETTTSADEARKELRRRPSFKALEAYRSERPAASVMSEREYYEDTDVSGTAAAPGMKKYRPYAQMSDVTEAGQSSAKLVEEMNRDEDMPRTAPSAMGGMPGMEPKEYPFSEEFRDLQRAVGDVERRPDGTVRYKKVVEQGKSTMKAVPNMMPKPEIQAALSKAIAVYSQEETDKKAFIEELANIIGIMAPGSATPVPALMDLQAELRAVANGTSKRLVAATFPVPPLKVAADIMREALAIISRR